MSRRLVAYFVATILALLSCQMLFAQDMTPPPPPDMPETASPAVEKTPSPSVVSNPKVNWPMFRRDASHSAYIDQMLQFPQKLAWKYVSNIPSGNPCSPAVVDGIAYFCVGNRVYAIDAKTGELKWKYPEDQPLESSIRSAPVVGDDLIYFGCGDGRLYAITRKEGQQAWSFATKGIVSSPATLSEGVVYVSSSDKRLYALDALTGQPKWRGGFKTNDDVVGFASVAGGMVYFVSKDMVLYAALTSSGQIKWATRLGLVNKASSPVVADNAVYLASSNILQSYHAQSGHLNWGFTLPSEVTTVPAAADGAIYFACANNKLYGVTRIGKMKWKTPVDIGAPCYGSPVVAGDTVIISANKGQLMAVDTETGKVKWKYIVMPSILDSGKYDYVNLSASPVVADGSLYAVSDDGVLYAFNSASPDNVAPQIYNLIPSRDAIKPGAPPFTIAAVIEDPGSGINPDSIAMLLDNKPVEYKYMPEYGYVYYKTQVTQPVSPLPDGRHSVTVSVTDWSGNKADLTWYFTIDNKLTSAPKDENNGNNPPGVPGMPGGMPGMPPGGGPGMPPPPRF